MTWTLVVLDAVFSIAAGLLVAWGYLWLCARRDEDQAMANANIRARFDANRFDNLLIEGPVDTHLVLDEPSPARPGSSSVGVRRDRALVYDFEREL